MVRIVSIIVVVLLTAYLIGVSVVFRERRQTGVCKGVEIVVKDSLDKHFVDKRDLMELLKRDQINPFKRPLKDINTEEIEKELKNNEMIARVEAYKTPSGLIKLEVEQKIPIMRVMGASGNYYIDNQGGVMPISRRYVANVPIVSGHVEKGLMLTDLYKFALFLQNNDFWNDQIEQIYIESDNQVELIPRVGNHTIVLGNFENFEEKLKNLSLFYKRAIPKVGWEKYSVISLKYKNQIVCTKR